MTLSVGKRVDPVFLRQMDTVGDGSGTKNINQDYSAGSATLIKFAPTQKAFISTLTIQYSDNGAFQQNVYASLPSALTNGVRIDIYDQFDNVLVPLTDDQFVTMNLEWYTLGYRFIYNNWAGSNENTLVASLNFGDFGSSIVLDGSQNQFIAVSVNDDFTSLSSQTFTVEGVY